MHPYEMQRLLKERRKDRVVGIGQRSSFYQAIGRLQRDGLIVASETVQSGARPERTVYAITDRGRSEFFENLRAMLAKPREIFPDFPVAISYLPLLDVEDALSLLDARRAALAAELADIEAGLAHGIDFLHRMMLLEVEFRRKVVAAELEWLTEVIGDIRDGRLSWSAESVAAEIARLSPVRAD